MEVVKENQLELVVCTQRTSLQDLLVAQRELFHSQIDQLETIVASQCRLTGVNPLSQEMAAGALSIKIGKRPRDLLNPKAIKYMQSVFSIKDAITKKETREISALFGVTATQVREFFTTQRSRVRKFVRLSGERANRSTACKGVDDGVSSNADAADPNIPSDPVPLDSVAPIAAQGPPSCSTQDDVLPALDESDRRFVENIFSSIRREETFSGQVKLLEWILQIQSPSVLYWFLTKGGVMILATWLSQAAVEEQTSVLHVVLKVLCHLPLHKALPVHMSAILQSVNRLRFYRSSDISNKARVLLSRWSKIFARSQALKKANGVKSVSDTQDEMLLKQSINEVMNSEVNGSEDASMALCAIPDGLRTSESPQPLKMLTASADDSNKKLTRGVLSSQSRKRRKVQLVEQPGQRTAGKNTQVAKSTPASQSRPISADDIQKAKMRAQFMQSKYGKPCASNESPPVKTEVPNKSTSTQASIFTPAKEPVQPKIEESKKADDGVSPVVASQLEPPADSNTGEPPWKKCKRVAWHTPPEYSINVLWKVCAGENSKEVEVQKNRIRREMEINYRTIQEIPSNPREPWDREMDYDDTLTPEIPLLPVEQLQLDDDGEGAVETVISSSEENAETVAASASTSTQDANGNVPEPDLELLAVLLNNPELVYALTSGQASGLSNEETVKLLDMIKANGLNSTDSRGAQADERVEVSLPSPTPSSHPVTSGWGPDFARNPFSRQATAASREAYGGQVAAVLPQDNFLASGSVQAQISAQQSVVSIHGPSQQASLLQMSNILSGPQQPPVNPILRHTNPAKPVTTHHTRNSELVPNNLLGVYGFPGSVGPTVQNTPERHAPPLPRLTPQAAYVPEPAPSVSHHPWGARQGYESIPHYHDNRNPNNYNAVVGRPPAFPQQLGSWQRNELVDARAFESWSPDNSPTRSREYTPGWNHPRLGTNYSHNHSSRPERLMPPGNPGRGGGNKRWHHDQRR